MRKLILVAVLSITLMLVNTLSSDGEEGSKQTFSGTFVTGQVVTDHFFVYCHCKNPSRFKSFLVRQMVYTSVVKDKGVKLTLIGCGCGCRLGPEKSCMYSGPRLIPDSTVYLKCLCMGVFENEI